MHAVHCESHTEHMNAALCLPTVSQTLRVSSCRLSVNNALQRILKEAVVT
jgi:hypothetical protein